MKKRALLSICLAVLVLIALAVLAVTKPDRASHYEAIKKEVLVVIDKEMNSNAALKEFAAMGTLKALNAMDEYMGRYLILREHTFYTVGVIIYKDQLYPVSVGALGHVWLTVGEKDLEQVVTSPDMMKLIGVDELKQVILLLH
ncbi:MAG: hypothetical protein II822_08825 [Prevotella sp.]|nr:hypothetical protein [Prevotella sp.]